MIFLFLSSFIIFKVQRMLTSVQLNDLYDYVKDKRGFGQNYQRCYVAQHIIGEYPDLCFKTHAFDSALDSGLIMLNVFDNNQLVQSVVLNFNNTVIKFVELDVPKVVSLGDYVLKGLEDGGQGEGHDKVYSCLAEGLTIYVYLMNGRWHFSTAKQPDLTMCQQTWLNESIDACLKPTKKGKGKGDKGERLVDRLIELLDPNHVYSFLLVHHENCGLYDPLLFATYTHDPVATFHRLDQFALLVHRTTKDVRTGQHVEKKTDEHLWSQHIFLERWLYFSKEMTHVPSFLDYCSRSDTRQLYGFVVRRADNSFIEVKPQFIIKYERQKDALLDKQIDNERVLKVLDENSGSKDMWVAMLQIYRTANNQAGFIGDYVRKSCGHTFTTCPTDPSWVIEHSQGLLTRFVCNILNSFTKKGRTPFVPTIVKPHIDQLFNKGKERTNYYNDVYDYLHYVIEYDQYVGLIRYLNDTRIIEDADMSLLARKIA